MGESLVEAPKVDTKMGESFALPCLQESVSFGRFEHDSLCWERWSTFPTNKYLEEVEKCSTPGSVAQKKAYFEAHYKRIAARKAELLDQERKREEEECANLGDRSPVGLTCNTSEEEFDVEKSSTQNSVDGTEVPCEVGESTDEVSVKHIDIIGYGADIIIEEDGVADLNSEVSEYSDEVSDHVDVDELNEEADIMVEQREHIDALSDHFDFTDEVADIMVEQSEHIDEPNDEAGVAEEKKDIQPEHFEEEINGANMIKEKKDIQPNDTDGTDVAEEKRDLLPELIIDSNSGTNMIKENKDIQTQLVDVNEDSCLKVEISHIEKPDEPVLVKEDTASARVWHDKEVLPQEKVVERKVAEKGAKNPVKLVDPMKTKKMTTDTTNSKKNRNFHLKFVVNCNSSDAGSSSSSDYSNFRQVHMPSFGLSSNENACKQSYKWQRVLLKVSGEALAGDNAQNIDPKVTMAIAREVASVTRLGIEVAIVVGGGNIFRGSTWAGCSGLDRSSADYIGMMATVMNAIFLQATMESIGIPTRVQTAFRMSEVAEPYIRRRAVRHLEKGRVVIFAAGTGNPFFTTDTAAALRCAEINAEVVLKATNVDGVYDKDPRKNSDARLLDTLSYQDVISKELSVMDLTAITLCQENNIPVVVFNLNKEGDISKAIQGEIVGTIIGGQRQVATAEIQ